MEERKQFRVYQSPPKYIDNHLELQRMIKKNVKILKSIEYGDTPTDDMFISTRDPPRPASFAKLIKKNKCLSSFKALVYHQGAKKCLHVLPALKSISSLAQLSLEDINSETFTPKISHAFTHCTRNLKDLANLECQDGKSLQTLHFVAPLHSLSHLSLNLYHAKWVSDESLLTLSNHLPFLISLKSLSLDLTHLKDITKMSLLSLFSSFSRLSLLTSLSLRVGGYAGLDFSTTISLFENLKDLQNFQDLDLQLGSKNHLKSDDRDPLAVGLALLNPSSFRKLSLRFYQGYSDSDLSTLFTILQRFSSLTHLSLRVSQHDQVTSEGFSNLPSTLAQLSHLANLKFCFSRAIETGSFFKMICLCLKNRKELVSLKLDTWSCETVDSVGLQNLCSQLQGLPKLQDLELSLGSHSKLDAQSIESLSQALLKLTDLKSLDLTCSADGQCADDVFDDLVRSIGDLTHLRKLALWLGGKFDLKKEIVENVTTSVKSLNSLGEFYMNLEMRHKGDKNLEQFKDLLRVLDSHKRLLDISVNVPYFWDNKSWKEFQHKIENKAKKFHIYIN